MVATGEVRWFSPEWCFGFITPDGGGDPVYVSGSNVEDLDWTPLVQCPRVEYELAIGAARPFAKHVRVIRADR